MGPKDKNKNKKTGRARRQKLDPANPLARTPKDRTASKRGVGFIQRRRAR